MEDPIYDENYEDTFESALWKMIKERGIAPECDHTYGHVPEELLQSTHMVITGMATMFNLMRQFPHKVEEHAAEYKRLKELCPLFHVLMGSLLMDAIFAELPMWFDQVRPISKLAPSPNVEEIDNAAKQFVDRSSG